MIQTTCRGCGQSLKVKDHLAGKKVKCPGCGDPLRIPIATDTVKDMGPLQSPSPSPSPPPPRTRPEPVAIPVALPPPEPQAGFDFSQIGAGAPAGEPAAFGGLAESAGAPAAPRRRRKSPIKSWATHGALVGAVAGALLIGWLATSAEGIRLFLLESTMIEALNKALPKLQPETIRGAVVGLVGGLLLGCLLLAVVGKSIESFCGALVLLVGGAAYGGYRRADTLEMTWPILIMGTVAGILAGALLGLIVGAIIAAARPRS